MTNRTERPLTLRPQDVARARELLADWHAAAGDADVIGAALVSAHLVGFVDALLAEHDAR